jgi:hypothetical protein
MVDGMTSRHYSDSNSENYYLLKDVSVLDLVKIKQSGGATSWRNRGCFFIWVVRLLALRPLLAYCASLG